ncbi:hypothetical protein J2Y45_001831 [Dyadobacter sp. BE34]|uniref:Thiopeptide-type bacteriocin biosynthesis domain-containing protein n=1 Tax=Dyadobacter fermentans TaxID=94254 RepID=A0ABU1QU06_9BACT|nr:MULTISPECIES: hypothetical protein [Dyadobacter]MDR6804563.1 hypothetical protein [Dyadobacter fermentans]MDR7042303.1 hypothetical protein [Dyadobacter sp. BE242]MDR7196705.1 hypothetical protein [Dyadobacter sp. BE34]MDR7212750.1 hypothetical protein [Dyadobacter sp. BE31]MDR7262112.1 hypothetical protein [Dyadobacter sp. BE32]
MIVERSAKRIAANASLFYAEEAWPVLIEKVLFPILCSYERYEGFGYIVHFSTDRGDGIHVTIFSNEKRQLSEILSKIKDNASLFFSNTPSRIVRQSRFLPMFANFNNNSVHFGIHLFLPKAPYTSSGVYLSVWEKVSMTLLKQLAKTDFSLENLFWLAIQIILLLSLKSDKFRMGLIKNIKEQSRTGNIPDIFEQRYKESQRLLNEIMNDSLSMRDGKFDDENTFINQICLEVEFLEGSDVKGGINPEIMDVEIVLFIVINLRTILGYNLSNSLLADFFLYRTLQDYPNRL